MMARLVKAQDKLLKMSPDEAAVEAIYAQPQLAAVSNG